MSYRLRKYILKELMMRDCNVHSGGIPEEEAIPIEYHGEAIFKEVVIIGNGPSGITLSYLLSGNCPYYNRKAHPDPMLSARLIECTQKPLLQQDLAFLSQGIEGRSKNPVSLLIDAMTHPGADMGLQWPSLLSWRRTNREVEHVVLGRGEPGGAWQGIAENVLTISPGRWMSLPGLEMKEYRESRAPAPAVFRYYNEYIDTHGLSKYMVNNTAVTLVQPVKNSRRRCRWRVWTQDINGVRQMYECRTVVLATGASDRAGCLGVPGESLLHVTHDLVALEDRLAMPPSPPASPRPHDNAAAATSSRVGRKRHFPENQEMGPSGEMVGGDGGGGEGPPPVLVVGAGLSAADAIVLARSRGFPVLHVFRSAKSNVITSLPSTMYPEYHEVHALMQGLKTSPDYMPLPGYQVTEFSEDCYVNLRDSADNCKEMHITAAAVLIGSQPDLTFLPPKMRHLGTDVNKPVDCKSNPIVIEPFSYKCVRGPPGLYALGPLVGDNFVRFLQGGAIAVASRIYKECSLHRDT